MQRKSSVILNDARKGTFSYGFTHLLSAGVSLSVSECIAEWKPWYTSRIRYTGTGCLNIVWFTRDPKVLTPQASNQKETAKWVTTFPVRHPHRASKALLICKQVHLTFNQVVLIVCLAM